MTMLSYLGAIGAAQREAMEADERVIIFGEDVEANVYGTTGGKSRAEKGDFLTLFGSDRIRNTPISEEVMVGTAAGAAIVAASQRQRLQPQSNLRLLIFCARTRFS